MCCLLRNLGQASKMHRNIQNIVPRNPDFMWMPTITHFRHHTMQNILVFVILTLPVVRKSCETICGPTGRHKGPSQSVCHFVQLVPNFLGQNPNERGKTHNSRCAYVLTNIVQSSDKRHTGFFFQDPTKPSQSINEIRNKLRWEQSSLQPVHSHLNHPMWKQCRLVTAFEQRCSRKRVILSAEQEVGSLTLPWSLNVSCKFLRTPWWEQPSRRHSPHK